MQKIDIHIEQVLIDGELFFKISNVDKMRPFFMSIVSDANHWMFIGSNGGLSAGRKNSESALFPYYTDDKIIESAEQTGSKTIFQVKKDDQTVVWEPFSIRNAVFKVERNLYKNTKGNKILFEEINHDLNLTFQYQWNSSNTYGFVRKSCIQNNSSGNVEVSLLDGIQNILPYGVGSMLQNQRSNLVDAYKRSELDEKSGLGIFALSAIIVDRAEPSEALKANIAWSIGLDDKKHLLSSLQLDSFRKGLPIEEEVDVKAEKGAYFINSSVILSGNSKQDWMIVTNVNQNISGITKISESILEDASIKEKIQQDIELGSKHLVQLNAAADGIQLTQDRLKDTRHFANSLFNIMRGGIFDDNYQIEKGDFTDYLKNANKNTAQECQSDLAQLSESFTLENLKDLASKLDNSHFKRLCIEYLPLKFSRRHGDPSRPWNQFSINTHNEDGSKILDYEGNWRDIFQNWEALAHSYPEFIEGMIFKFLNASTFDGYNPYRVTKNGIDWERIEPDDPWSYIGYWGDHQIIYLLKFLEFVENHDPGKLESYFNESTFVYADVPYRIKPYAEILKDPKDTIDFDEKADNEITRRWSKLGADSALLQNKQGAIHEVNFMEKILATVLSKMSNFIPEAGIWMNTQRPEWNDANNALVGNGVSMVTLCYLRRFFKFFDQLLDRSNTSEVSISSELKPFFNQVAEVLQNHKSLLNGAVNDENRKSILDGLGIAGSSYRENIYKNSFSGDTTNLLVSDIKDFLTVSMEHLEHSIDANKRPDDLYHAYNLMTVENDKEVSVGYLSEMLEGQVAVLSAKYLSPEANLKVLDGLKKSKLFREDQYSYMLYPNKDLEGFTVKNVIPTGDVEKSTLLMALVTEGDNSIIEQDIRGKYHFNGNLKNADDLEKALIRLSDKKHADLVIKQKKVILSTFEKVFNHKAFTGRSGTFFGYEGLGSIYWHMVSKLQLAVFECCHSAIEENADASIIGRLLEHYYEINESIGVHKPPSLYGAFPTDPYSHTPFTKGAQQPGMTGQVKEDILSRFGELGIEVKEGKLGFNPKMLRKAEFLTENSTFEYVDIENEWHQLPLQSGALAFTYCQIPIIYQLGDDDRLEVIMKNGDKSESANLSVEKDISACVFERDGSVKQIVVHLNHDKLL